MMFSRLLFFILFLLGAQPLLADSPNTTVFPPVTTDNQECAAGEMRVLSWARGNRSTMCLTGQEVLKLAIPNCLQGQQVAFDGVSFLCQSEATIPTCGERESLTYDGARYTCRAQSIPTCAASQVLTSSNGDFVCIERGDRLPACGAAQFLTFNGTAYQCADIQQTQIPNCGANQYVTSFGGVLGCADLARIPTASQIVLTQAKLREYHKDCKSPFESYMNCAAACSRFCSDGCKGGVGDGSCSALNNGNRFTGGVVSEWSSSDVMCTCFH